MDYYKPSFIEYPEYKTFSFFEDVLKDLEDKPFHKECIVVAITGEEYDVCDDRSQGENFKANSNPGTFGKGLISSKDDQFKTVRIGLLGQMAFGKVFGLDVDIAYREKGDEFDFMLGDNKADIKCASQPHKINPYNLEQHTRESGRIKPINKEYYVQSFLDYEDREGKKAIVVLVGYVTKKDVEESQKIKSSYAEFTNHKLAFIDAKPIRELVEKFKLI
jgi:hypothetical protein